MDAIASMDFQLEVRPASNSMGSFLPSVRVKWNLSIYLPPRLLRRSEPC